MAKRKPKDPMQVMREAAERRAAKAEVERLKGQGDVTVRTEGQKIVSARRIDVFALQHERGGLSDEALGAVRRLEQDFGAASGADKGEQSLERVDGGGNYPPGQNVTQRMIDASRYVSEILRSVGPVNARLLTRLIEGGAALTKWREVVQQVTGETHSNVQGAMVRAACENLVGAYQALDYGKAA